MTDEQINIAIAEACGYRPCTEQAYPNRPAHLHPKTFELIIDIDLPDYCHDLNAMHEAWCSLSKDEHLLFRSELAEIVRRDGHIFGPCRSACNASAKQRAEAFVRIKDKWIA